MSVPEITRADVALLDAPGVLSRMAVDLLQRLVEAGGQLPDQLEHYTPVLTAALTSMDAGPDTWVHVDDFREALGNEYGEVLRELQDGGYIALGTGKHEALAVLPMACWGHDGWTAL